VTFTEPQPTQLALMLLGRGSDAESERGVDCPGDLPPASDPDLVERARAAKAALGDRLFILGHHYQRDEVVQFADVTVTRSSWPATLPPVLPPTTSSSAACTSWPSPPISSPPLLRR